MAETENNSTHSTQKNTIELQTISLKDASTPPTATQPMPDVETSASGRFLHLFTFIVFNSVAQTTGAGEGQGARAPSEMTII